MMLIKKFNMFESIEQDEETFTEMLDKNGSIYWDFHFNTPDAPDAKEKNSIKMSKIYSALDADKVDSGSSYHNYFSAVYRKEKGRFNTKNLKNLKRVILELGEECKWYWVSVAYHKNIKRNDANGEPGGSRVHVTFYKTQYI